MDDLWQDIVALFEEGGEASHYMGYLVLQSSDSKRFDIIDGQQRMTTIIDMVLSALSAFAGSCFDAKLDASEQRQKKGPATQQLYRLR